MGEERKTGKTCVQCGHPLPEKASFCPYCTAVQCEKKKVKTPKRWKKKALVGGLVLVILVFAGGIIVTRHRPKTYEGTARAAYPDSDKTYTLLLSFSASEGMNGHAQGELTDTIAEGMESVLPCQLYIFDQETEELAWEEFSEKVDSCQVEIVPQEGSKKLNYADPVHNEDFPNAAYVSDVQYGADSGTNDIFWTLRMKNGDTITLQTRLTIEKRKAVTYTSKDTAMETSEELRSLLATIEEELSADTPVYLYLPAETYDGDFVFGDHVWRIYGSTEGEERTTFTGTVSVKGQNGNYAEMDGIDFVGKGGTGLDAYCFVTLSGCGFDGWEVAALAEDGAWVHVSESVFTDNTVGLKLDSTFAYGTSPNYLDNVFTGNQTAVCIAALPGEEVLDFTGSTFSGNGTDIENPADHPVSTVNATFE